MLCVSCTCINYLVLISLGNLDYLHLHFFSQICFQLSSWIIPEICNSFHVCLLNFFSSLWEKPLQSNSWEISLVLTSPWSHQSGVSRAARFLEETRSGGLRVCQCIPFDSAAFNTRPCYCATFCELILYLTQYQDSCIEGLLGSILCSSGIWYLWVASVVELVCCMPSGLSHE